MKKRDLVKTRAGAIRAVGASDLSQTNAQVRQKVQEEYGHQVSSAEIVQQLGAYRDRQFMGRSAKARIQAARDFVARVGNLRDAVRLLHLSQQK